MRILHLRIIGAFTTFITILHRLCTRQGNLMYLYEGQWLERATPPPFYPPFYVSGIGILMIALCIYNPRFL